MLFLGFIGHKSQLSAMLKAQSETRLPVVCVHIYDKRNSLCIYSTYTVQEHHLIIIYLLIVLWKGCIYFWYYGIFGSSVYWRNNGNSSKKKKTIFDGPSGRMSVCQEGIPLFEGAEHELEAWVQGFVCSLNKTSDRDPTNNKHNFVSFCLSYQIISLFSSSFIFSRSHQHFSSSSYYV